MNDRERFLAATDGARLADVLRPLLENAWGSPVGIDAVEVPRVFPRRGGGLTLQYRVRARRHDATPEVRLLGGRLLAADEPWPRWAREPDARIWRDRSLRLLVPCFPYDPTLPHLAAWFDRAHVATELSRLLRTPLDTAPLQTRVLAYRLEKRCVLRCEWSGHEGVVVKLFGKRIPEPALHATALIAARAGAAMVPRTLAVDPAAQVQVSEIVPGTSLHDLAGSAEFAAGCAQGARILRSVHELPGTGLPPSGPPDAVQELAELARALAATHPESASELRALVREFEASGTGAAPRTGMLHGDFYDKQVLHGPARTAVLDWDAARAGDGARDHGNFTAHLVLRALQAPAAADGFAAGRAAFESAYGVPDAGFFARAKWWEAATLARLGGLYALRPRWGELAPRLFSLSRAALASTGEAPHGSRCA